jgi:hypothetical protein
VALMILRRITLERYACFGSAEFEFRRGMNLLSGGNDAGKSLLLASLPAALFGVEHGSRMRSWGETLSCRVTVLFEGADRGVRLTRDLETNLVRLEESGSDGVWRDCFAGKVAVAGASAERITYFGHLQRLFHPCDEASLRALLDAIHPEVVFSADGLLAAGLLSGVGCTGGAATMVAPIASAGQRQQELADLENELAEGRGEYRKGEEYLAWIRKRWETDGKGSGKTVKSSAGKSAARDQVALERQRDDLQAELRKQGLPARLPADLPALFDKAEGLRQELAALQLELTPLQRRRQALVMPGILWVLLTTLAGLAASAAAFWVKVPWFLPLAAGCCALLLLVWGVYLVRLSRARAVRDALDQEVSAVEARRAEALVRQGELAEQFEAYGLPSTPVEMVKLQQACRRNQELLDRYRELCLQSGGEPDAPPAAGQTTAASQHLRPEDLPDAEARLAELGESLRRREARLQVLRDGTATVEVAAPLPSAASPVLKEHELLRSIGQQLERLTAGRYHELRLEEGLLCLEAAPGRWAAPTACSRGTAACLTLAVRMAVSLECGDRLPLPVDDLPAQLDAKRHAAALRALERFALDHQLLLASCDEELAKRAARERWHVIGLDTRQSGPSVATEEKADAGQMHLL